MVAGAAIPVPRTRGIAMPRRGVPEDAAAGRRVLADAAGRAPRDPGVYVFLGAGTDVLYVGKAENLRQRLTQHAAAGPPTSHLHRRYALVREVRWEVAATDEAAAWREADLIFALRPPFNAESVARSRGRNSPQHRPRFLSVTLNGPRHRFALEPQPPPSPGRAYGCFPHLGKGMSSRLGIACSDGYVAFLRFLWAASGQGSHIPAGITRAAPDSFEVAVEPGRARRLHDFLAGVSPRLLEDLAEAAAARPAYMQPALARDRDAALGFFAAGPRALRARRLRHKVPAGVVTPELYRELVAAELRDAIGPFAKPARE